MAAEDLILQAQQAEQRPLSHTNPGSTALPGARMDTDGFGQGPPPPSAPSPAPLPQASPCRHTPLAGSTLRLSSQPAAARQPLEFVSTGYYIMHQMWRLAVSAPSKSLRPTVLPTVRLPALPVALRQPTHVYPSLVASPHGE